MQTRKDIINRTLTLLGVGERVSRRNETENAKIIDDDIVPGTVNLLQRYNFKFASKFASLPRGDVNPNNEFYTEYELPEDFINLMNVYTDNDRRSLLNILNDEQASGREGNKQIITLGRKLLLSTRLAESYENLNILYTHRILFSDEANNDEVRQGYVYPYSFCEVLAISLSLRNSRVIRNDPTMDNQLWNLYNKEIDSLTESEGIDNSQPIQVNVLDPSYYGFDINIYNSNTQNNF